MKKIKNKLFYLYSVILYTILAFIAFILSFIYLEPGIRSFFTSTFAAHNSGINNNTVIVVVDEVSRREFPVWNTAISTELLDYFHTYAKPKVIGFDFFAPSINPMKKSDIDFLNQINKMDNLVIGFTPEYSGVTTEDKVFLEKFQNKYAVNTQDNPFLTNTKFQKVSHALKPYLEKTDNLASVIIKDEKDTGTIYSTINLVQVGDRYFPSLPLKMYLIANNTNNIELNDTHIIVEKTKLKIPHNLISRGNVRTNIKYYDYVMLNENGKIIKSDYTHFAISASKIINIYRKLKTGKELDKVEQAIKDQLIDKDTAVFIGEFADGPSSDFLKTPMSSRQPGVDVQATIYDNINNNDFLYTANGFTQFAVIILLAVITFICIFKLRFIQSLLGVILIDIIFFVLTAAGAYNGFLLDFITPITIQLVTLIFGYSFKFIDENRNKEKIKQAMGKYLSQDIMKNVISNIDELKLGGKRAIVTVLFSDIRGFTSLSEKMSAEDVSLILNEYFAEMEPIITKYNGVINKFIGDAVMAIFGEPIQDINHPRNAVKCAYEMLKKVEYLQDKWLHENKPKIEIGIGINTGEVFIGNIGTETRMEYTVIGDTVNLASRIESYNKVYKTNLLVSSSTYAHIADIADVIKISEVQIRGKSKKMNIYEVLRIDKNS